jgi:hypothetical protein
MEKNEEAEQDAARRMQGGTETQTTGWCRVLGFRVGVLKWLGWVQVVGVGLKWRGGEGGRRNLACGRRQDKL